MQRHLTPRDAHRRSTSGVVRAVSMCGAVAGLVLAFLAAGGCRATTAAGPRPDAIQHMPHSGLSKLRPSNDRDWMTEQSRLATAEFRGGKVHVRNIRNFEYRSDTDFDPAWHNKTYDLRKLATVEFLVVPFPASPSLAHTFLSFGFDDGEQLAVSIEIRREKGEEYHPLAGALARYELMYVVGEERDLIGVRANHRLNDVYLYSIRASRSDVRALFKDVFQRANQLTLQPEFYNTLTNNCTTNIFNHVNRIAPHKLAYDYRVLFPGYSDRLAYDRGLINTSDSFEVARDKARINELAYRYREAADFSAKIRR